jgi:hypothetical protein
MLIGYARVSTDDQSLSLQRDALMRQSQKPSGYLSHHFINDVVAWNYAARIPKNLTNPTVYRGNWKRWDLQSQGLHYFQKLGRQNPPLTAIFAYLARKRHQSKPPIPTQPSMDCAIRYPCLPGDHT